MIVEICFDEELDFVLPCLVFVLVCLILLVLLIIFKWYKRRNWGNDRYTETILEQPVEIKQDFLCLKKQIENIEDKCKKLERTEKEIKKELYQIRSEFDLSKKTSSFSEVESVQPQQTIKQFVDLTVKGGKLKLAGMDDVVYYIAWKENHELLFNFASHENVKKIINNRFSIVDPFCETMRDSKFPEEADMIEVAELGILNEKYEIVKKIKIKYL